MDEPEVSKDVVFEQPKVPSDWAADKTRPRGHWLLSEVEEAMWRVRASGGTDGTSIRTGPYEIRAEGVEAFPFEVPPRREPPPAGPRWRAPSAQALGVLTALPVVLTALVLAWALLCRVVWWAF